MSGAPKGGHSTTPLKRPIEEIGSFSSPGKFVQPANNDFHLPFEHGQEGRMTKVQRVELRDTDKRFSQLHRMSSAPSNSADHPIMSENRLELKSSKDGRDGKNEIREAKSDSRVLYSDTRVDAQVNKMENDARIDGRTYDRISHNDNKSEVKFEMDSGTANNSHTSWKDHHRGKRYYEPPTDGPDSWRARSFQSTDEVAKEPLNAKDRDLGETQEAVGENKVDLKIEEKIREKDRKRKDDKHRDFGEKDKHSIDRRSNALGGPSSREERDTEKWDRDKKDFQKEKEINDRDKEPVKREPSNVNERETVQLEKDHVDGSGSRAPGQENTLQEYKRVKDETWKGYERDTKEKKGEKDFDVEDRHEQRGKGHEKEPDDGCTEGDAAIEKEKEAFGGVQHRRRMSRSRGTPQASQREARLRSRARDSEGPQGARAKS